MKPLTWVKARFRRRSPPTLDADDPTLEVVVSAFDVTEAASAALERSAACRRDHPAVLRHHLLLPAEVLAHARETLAADGWTPQPVESHSDSAGNDLVPLIVTRIGNLDALHCAQDSSRMAGLAQRLGGRAEGWEAMQPAGQA